MAALGYQHGRHQVYNIAVEAEHCYFVGTGGVLTHNMCGPDGGSLALEGSAKKPPNPGNGVRRHESVGETHFKSARSVGEHDLV